MENTNNETLITMYSKLFNELTDICEELDKLKEKIKSVQIETEEMYISEEK